MIEKPPEVSMIEKPPEVSVKTFIDCKLAVAIDGATKYILHKVL